MSSRRRPRPSRPAAVIERKGKRAVTWSLKYVDASGKQCWERLGTSAEGWNRRLAEAELRDRLVKVEKRGWRKPAPLTFAEYAERWFTGGERRRRWKDSTVLEYRSVRRRLEDEPATPSRQRRDPSTATSLGELPLAAVRPRDVADLIESMQKAGYAAATIGRDVSVLSALFESAVREELVDANPARRAERP